MSYPFAGLLFGFQEHMKVKNYAPATMTAYRREIEKFFGYLQENGIPDIQRVTRGLLQAYQATLMESVPKGILTLATVALKTRAIKRFFEYLEQSNQVPPSTSKSPRKRRDCPGWS